MVRAPSLSLSANCASARGCSRRVANRRRHSAGKSFLLLDVRTAQERTTACIAGSVHVPLAELESRIEELREYEGQEICTLCHHGVRSLRAAAALRRAGFDHVRSMAGGIHLWSVDIDPSVPIY